MTMNQGAAYRRLLELGGSFAIVGGILFIVVAALTFANPGLFSEMVSRGLLNSLASGQAGNRALYLGVKVLLVISSLMVIPFYFALYRVLRTDQQAYTLLGTFFGLIAEVLASVSTALAASSILRIGEAYTRSGPVQQDALLEVGNVLFAVAAGINVLGGVLFGVSLLLFGGAILGGRVFDHRLGWTAILLGLFLLFSLIPGLSLVTIIVQFPIAVWFIALGGKLLTFYLH